VLGNIVPSVTGETSTSAAPPASADQVKDLVRHLIFLCQGGKPRVKDIAHT